jgi:lipoate---protein ligase
MFLLQTPQIFDPKINLAIEEYMVRKFDTSEDLLFIYQNSPSLIIGKNQNPFEEINLNFLIAEKLEMYRRISGGGAVYHDLGNINFSYITNNTRENFNNYKNFLEPVITLLKTKGIAAEINPRNDIVIDKLKISGNAQFSTRGRMFSHGTLLFNADLDKINQSLKVKEVTIESKSTKSVRSTITNISSYLNESCNINFFLDDLVQCITDSFAFSGHISPDKNQWAEIEKIADEKYSSWEWNWGRTPKFDIQVLNPYTDTMISISIENCIINSKNVNPVDSFSKLLCFLDGVRYDKENIKNALDGINTLTDSDRKMILMRIFPF